MKAIILRGVSCSGKTTLAKELCKSGGYIDINRDALRFSLFGATNWGDYKFTKGKEGLITSIQRATVKCAAEAGKGVVISDTNISVKTLNGWQAYLRGLNYSVEVRDLEVSLEEAWNRDRLRVNGVGHQVIWDQYLKLQKVKGRKVYEPNNRNPPAYIFDVDGTLADMKGVRGPFDWARVSEDKPVWAVIDVLRSLSSQGNEIIVMSGRDGVCYHQTRKWLVGHGVLCDLLLMREEGDNRKDSIIKEELFWEEVAPHYNIRGVFDDRPCMTRHWRELGLKVFDVGDPLKEF